MSRFLELKEGIWIRVDQVEVVLEHKDESDPTIQSMVYTHHNDYPSTFPATVLKDILEINNVRESTETSSQDRVLKELATISHKIGEQGRFAG